MGVEQIQYVQYFAKETPAEQSDLFCLLRHCLSTIPSTLINTVAKLWLWKGL